MTAKMLEILGKNIKFYRLKNGFSIKELSNKSGIRKEYLKKIEDGKAFGVKISHIFIISEVLNVFPHDLAEGI